MTAIIVLTKAPVPGTTKTRLCPPLTHAQAADVARGALQDTLAAVLATSASRRVIALDGEPGRWCDRFEVVAQRGTRQDERIASAFEDVGGPAVLIGMDTPQVTPSLLDMAIEDLEATDAVLGLAFDGGWWAMGLREPDRRAVEGVPMSTGGTGRAQLARLEALGLSPTLLPRLRDVDTIADARAVADAIPTSSFARELEATGTWRAKTRAAGG